MIQRLIKSWKDVTLFELPDEPFIAIPNNFGRRFATVNSIKYRDEAFSSFGFNVIYPEPSLQNIISNQFIDGAFVQEHTDFTSPGKIHVRVNWVIKKPLAGGNPIIDGMEISVDEGDAWICFASEEIHSSTPIFGGERMICSFGALIDRPKDFDMKGIFI